MGKWEEKYQQKIGETRINRDGVRATVVEYNGNRDMVIRYDDFGITKKIGRWERFDKGNFETPKEFYEQNKVGQRSSNGYEWATCIEYKDSSNVVIEFDCSKKHMTVSWGNFKRGHFSSTGRTTYFKGYYDTDEPVKDENGKTKKEYDAWHSILKRCYSEAVHARRSTYEGCEVCDDWKYYTRFVTWLKSQENYDKWLHGGKTWHIDKDILVKHNKIYGPEFCSLVPNNINGLLLRCDKNRGDYPIGVYYNKDVELYRAQCENPYIGRQVSLGYYETPEDAFYKGYKPCKEKMIKKVATDEYQKGNITKRCYDALMNYVVEIDD